LKPEASNPNGVDAGGTSRFGFQSDFGFLVSGFPPKAGFAFSDGGRM